MGGTNICVAHRLNIGRPLSLILKELASAGANPGRHVRLGGSRKSAETREGVRFAPGTREEGAELPGQ